MNQVITPEKFDKNALEQFAMLDDIDILSAIKDWQNHEDYVLSSLCKMILNRKFLRIKLKNKPIKDDFYHRQFDAFRKAHKLTDDETSYFVFRGEIENTAYSEEDRGIYILKGNGELADVASVSDHLNLKALSNRVVKYFMCYPKELD